MLRLVLRFLAPDDEEEVRRLRDSIAVFDDDEAMARSAASGLGCFAKATRRLRSSSLGSVRGEKEPLLLRNSVFPSFFFILYFEDDKADDDAALLFLDLGLELGFEELKSRLLLDIVVER